MRIVILVYALAVFAPKIAVAADGGTAPLTSPLDSRQERFAG